jgi:sugar phosphate isomerase/epimerase
MQQRRTFLKQTGTMALGTLLFSKQADAFSKPLALPAPGLQLFTFFNVIDDDVQGTMKKIADIGYKNIESAFSKKGGYYGMKPKEFQSMLKDLRLSWKSHHVLGAPFKLPPGAKMPTGADGKPITIPPMRNLRDNYQELVDEAAEGGVEFLVCANTPINTLDDIKNSITVLNKTAEAAKKAGLQFAYHNHDAEFRAVEGKIPYELFLTETDPNTVKMELDLAWAVKGGHDPVDLFTKHPGRFPLWHVKDLDKERNTILPVGEGTIDFKRIFAAASTAGMKYYFVEHDMPADPFASITTSIRNLKNLG